MGMCLNPNKSQAIIISNNKRQNIVNKSIILDGLTIPYKKEVKYLGYIINNSINSDSQINSIIKKSSYAIEKVMHTRKFLPKECKEKIIKSVITPIFDYGSICYHGYEQHGSKKNQTRLQMLQNKCIRYIKKIDASDRITPHLNNLKILNLVNRRCYLINCFVYRYIKERKPAYLNNIFKINEKNTRNGTNGNTSIVKKVKRTKDELIFAHSINKMWKSYQ